MIICNARSLAFALLIAALPVGFALAGGGGGRGGAIGAGVGAADMGSAGVGGGSPAGQVGGGPPAGFVGGGLPGSNNPAGNGSAGTGNPSLNAVGGGPGGNGTNTPGIPKARTNGSVIGGDAGLEPPPRSHVQSRPKRASLGTAQAGARSMRLLLLPAFLRSRAFVRNPYTGRCAVCFVSRYATRPGRH